MAAPLSYVECCKVLDIQPGAAPEEIRRGYRRATMLWHPDRFPEGSELHAEAQDRIKAINDAYAFLLAHPKPEIPRIIPAPPPEKSSPKGTFQPAVVWSALAVGALLFYIWGRQSFFAEPPAPAQAAPVSTQPGNRSSASPAESTEVIEPPAVVIFSPTFSEAERLENEASRDFQIFRNNAVALKAQLKESVPRLLIHHTEAQRISIGAFEFYRHRTRGFGYILALPSRQPVVLEGAQPVEELVLRIQKALEPPSSLPSPPARPSSQSSTP